TIRTARNARPWLSGTPVILESGSTVPTAICEPRWMFQRRTLPVCRSIMTTASRPGGLPNVRPQRQYWTSIRSIAALILLGMVACATSGCGPDYGYAGYPGYGYAPYSYGWGD